VTASTDVLGAPDGRQIAFHATRLAESRGVVFVCHGMPGSGSLVEYAAGPAEEVGLSLVGVNRPGYGRSSPAAPGFSTAVGDVLRAADELGVGRFALLGVSGGGPFAAATALAAPRRVTGLGIAAGLGPWRVVEPPDTWDPDDAEVIDLAERGDVDSAAARIRDQARARFGPILDGDDEALAAAFLPAAAAGPTDEAGFRRWWAVDVREALASFDGLAYDNLTLGLPWNWSPANVKQPTWLWYGEADELVPVSHARWYETQLPQRHLTLRAGEGHGQTVFAHWTEMLARLAATLPTH
jgi:pimeloyl-ACP methyl ester carboxylesterase